LILFNTFSARLSASMKMMMMQLNKIHFVILSPKIQNKNLKFQMFGYKIENF